MRNRLPLTLLIALVVAAPVWTQGTRRALTIEDYYRVQSIGGPALSEDGRTVLLMGDCARRTKDTISGMWLYRNDSR